MPLPLAGAILTGGASRRMGRTKALVPVDGTPMALRVARALVAVGCDPVMLIGGDADELGALGMALVPDRYPGAGPAGGVITALEASDGDVLVVACDLPDLSAEALQAIVAEAATSTLADVVVARTTRIEPVCALWRQRALPGIVAAFDGGERSLHRIVERLVSVSVSVPPAALANVNRPGDLPR